MKKVLFVFVLCLGYFSNAQEFSFGVRGGYNLAGIQGDNANGFQMRHGFHIGIVTEIKITNTFSVQPEISYSQQGSDQSSVFIFEEFPLIDTALEARYNYLNVPVLAKYYVFKGFSVEVGPQVGFLLSAEVDDGMQVVSAKDQIKTIDVGVTIGIGYKLTNGLNFGVRYNAGFTNINDVSNTNTKNNNGVMQLSIGYFL
ncbi:MAG: porin family protein [Bacteroidota bacterium]